jgi:prepilin-type N-terminal cleavage/methylation domain-containing protein
MMRLEVRRGFTLVEMLVAMAIFAGLIAVAMTLFTSQVRAFAAGSERAELTLAGEFASAMLTRELRTAGTNTAPSQPWLVYAGANVVAFHADLVSRVPDPFAVYIDPSAPPAITATLRREDSYVLPGTAFTYPDSTYWAAAGVPAAAELLIYYFEADASTARGDDFVLRRRVNDAAPEIVARNILRRGAEPFFQFLRLTGDTMPQLVPVPAAQLPLRHTVPHHLSEPDTGNAARIDSVRAIRFSFAATNGRVGADERRLDHGDIVWFRNGGLTRQRMCGSAPIFTSAVVATGELITGSPAVRIQWTPSLDETSGEEDVIRYVLWRTDPMSPAGDPLLSVPSGSATYEYVDKSVQPGETWIYSVAAQDCTPNISAPVASGTVVVPTP